MATHMSTCPNCKGPWHPSAEACPKCGMTRKAAHETAVIGGAIWGPVWLMVGIAILPIGGFWTVAGAAAAALGGFLFLRSLTRWETWLMLALLGAGMAWCSGLGG